MGNKDTSFGAFDSFSQFSSDAVFRFNNLEMLKPEVLVAGTLAGAGAIGTGVVEGLLTGHLDLIFVDFLMALELARGELDIFENDSDLQFLEFTVEFDCFNFFDSDDPFAKTAVTGPGAALL